jgi:inosine-uridine nucleoside N-ribohydrolase
VRALVAAAVALLALTGCTAAYDGDGELTLLDQVAPDADARPIVVDTDLAGDDLVALAFVLQRTDVRVEAVTIAGTGLVGCDPGADLVADLFHALREPPVPVACGREDPAREWPEEWREFYATGTGMVRADGITIHPREESAPELIAALAASTPGLEVLALGPLTNLGDLARQQPRAYARLAGITSMAGAVDIPAIDGVAEWNAAADPAPFQVVLDGPVPLTVVPDDPIPSGTPDVLLDAAVVGPIAAIAGTPKWWDTSTAAALVDPGMVAGERGAWTVDESGRLHRDGRGRVLVVRSFDEPRLADALAAAFG